MNLRTTVLRNVSASTKEECPKNRCTNAQCTEEDVSFKKAAAAGCARTSRASRPTSKSSYILRGRAWCRPLPYVYRQYVLHCAAAWCL